MKIKPILLLGTIAFAAIGAIIFIGKNNDHKECKTVITTSKLANGSIVKQSRHVCNEKFSL